MRIALLLMALSIAGCSRREPLPVYGEVPDFTLTSQSGSEFRGGQLDGKVWVADFFFTHCNGPCPLMTYKMRGVQDSVADLPDVRIVSFTIDPARDTPEVLAAYARKNRANPERWTFLTGPTETLHELSRNAFKLGDIDGSLNHSTRFVLVDRARRIRGYYHTLDKEGVEQLKEDVRRLAGEDS